MLHCILDVRAQETYLSKKARDMDDAQKQWGKWLKKAEAGGRVNEETLDKAVRTRVGVPHELRSRVWPLLCGALTKGAAPSSHARTHAQTLRAAPPGNPRGTGDAHSYPHYQLWSTLPAKN